MSPDTQQNVTVMVQLIFEHNFLAIVFVLGILTATGYALYKPSRGAILLMIGCTLLLFAFEYNKHIVDGLLEQTKGSLITERESLRIDWFLNKFLGKAATPLLYLAGIAINAFGVFLLYKEKKLKHV